MKKRMKRISRLIDILTIKILNLGMIIQLNFLNMLKTKIKSPFLIALSLIIVIGCKKISTPNEASKAIFGSWTYVSNSGGYSGSGGSTRFNSGSWVEITDNGWFITHENSGKKSKKRYKIELRESIHASYELPAIVQQSKKYDTYLINNDSLYLLDEAYDGYSYLFVKK